MLGSHRIHSSSYHPQSNGMIERFHRHLKGSITAHENTKWSDIIPIVLLGLRSAIKKDLNATSSQLVYGTTLRLPSDLISTDNLPGNATPTYVSNLISMMRKLNPIAPISHGSAKTYVNPSLKSCTHVFLRNDKIRPPLTPPYSGPHPVDNRNDKNFVITVNGKRTTVSIDRLKPAYKFSEEFEPTNNFSFLYKTNKQDNSDQNQSTSSEKPKITRSGRRVHFPKILVQDYFLY